MVIQFKSVTLTYPAQDKPALTDLNLNIQPGEFVVVYGPCGAGKSSLLNLLHRRQLATSGHLLIDDRDLSLLTRDEVPFLRRRVVYLHQSAKLLPNRSIQDNVALPLRLRGIAEAVVSRKVRAALADMGLLPCARAAASAVTLGERQLAALARALVVAPAILLADEPTGDLDHEAAAKLLEGIQRAHLRGTTVVMATHEPGLLQGAHKRVVRLDAGELVSDVSADRATSLLKQYTTKVRHQAAASA